MPWPPRFWSNKNKTSVASNHLDRKLVHANRSVRLPSLSQVKYLFRFLNRKEHWLSIGSIALAIIGIIGMSGVALARHIETIPAVGGTYSEAMIGQPKFINPLFSSDSDVDSDITSLVYAGLFHYDANQELQPYLAQSYTVSTDGKTYTVTLRPNLKWSDGQPLTAADVVFTFDTIQNTDVGSPLLETFQGIQVTAVDPQTIRFTLTQPFAPFLGSLTVGIIPEHIWGGIAPDTLRLAANNLSPIGAGLYTFSKLFKDSAGNISSYELTPNKYFWGTKPYIGTLDFSFFDDYQSALEAIRSQTIDAMSFIPDNLQSKLDPKKTNFFELHLPEYTALFFNQSAGSVLTDNNVRQALAEAIDKERIVYEALGGNAQTVTGPFLEGMLGYSPDRTDTPFDTDMANALLDKNWQRIQPDQYFQIKHDALLKTYQSQIAAFASSTSSTAAIAAYAQKIDAVVSATVQSQMSSDQTFYRENKKGNLLEITITTVDTPEYDATAALIKQMWAKIGVNAIIQTIDGRDVIRDLLKSHNYQALIYGEIIGYDPDPYPFWDSSQIQYPGLNIAGYANPAADKLLEHARSTLDPNTRAALYSQFQDLLQSDMPAVFLYTPYHLFAVSKAVKNVSVRSINSAPDRYATLTNWYIKTKWKWK